MFVLKFPDPRVEVLLFTAKEREEKCHKTFATFATLRLSGEKC
jgi:hypothetical protein